MKKESKPQKNRTKKRNNKTGKPQATTTPNVPYPMDIKHGEWLKGADQRIKIKKEIFYFMEENKERPARSKLNEKEKII